MKKGEYTMKTKRIAAGLYEITDANGREFEVEYYGEVKTWIVRAEGESLMNYDTLHEAKDEIEVWAERDASSSFDDEPECWPTTEKSLAEIYSD